MSQEKVSKTSKVSIQAGQHNLHYVPGKHGWNRASLRIEAEKAEKKPIEVYTKQELTLLLKHFYWEILIPKFHSSLYAPFVSVC